jgi:hypothetical protein
MTPRPASLTAISSALNWVVIATFAAGLRERRAHEIMYIILA